MTNYISVTKFDTVAEAFDASEIDTQYYTKAWQDAVESTEIVTDHGRTEAAFLSEDKQDVYFFFRCPGSRELPGLLILNKLSLDSVLDSCDFSPVEYDESAGELVIGEDTFGRDPASRTALRTHGVAVTTMASFD